MKSIAHYRKIRKTNEENRKPKIFILALFIAFAFMSGVLVGATTDIPQDVLINGNTGLGMLYAFFQGIVVRDVPRLARAVGNTAEFFLTATSPDNGLYPIGP